MPKYNRVIRIFPTQPPAELESLTSKVYYMVCPEGAYRAKSWLGLGWLVFVKRLHHTWAQGPLDRKHKRNLNDNNNLRIKNIK